MSRFLTALKIEIRNSLDYYNANYKFFQEFKAGLIAGSEFFKIDGLGSVVVFGLVISPENSRGEIVDKFGGVGHGIVAGVGAIGTGENEFVADDGAVDGEFVVAIVGAWGEVFIAGVKSGAGIHGSLCDNPGVDSFDAFVDIDIAVGENEDLGNVGDAVV